MLTSDIASACERLWPITGSDDWDKPGLAIGSMNTSVAGVLLAVDATEAVLDEAISLGLNFVLTHHPLFLKGVGSLVESTVKGKFAVKAVKAGVAVYSAHTNADIVENGVSDTLAKALGLLDTEPLVYWDYDSGHGRIGNLDGPISIEELVGRLSDILPGTTRGIAASVPAGTQITRVALCGGAGDSFIEAAAQKGADVYITSDLRHHVAQESPIALIDVSHWASESLWLDVAARQLRELLPSVSFVVSRLNTDPWIFRSGRT